jgi:hypothetical protein
VLKTITKNMFNVVAGITMIAAVFYLAAITHILPLPESALTRLSGFSSNVMDVLFACGSWVIRLFVDWNHFNHVRRDCSRHRCDKFAQKAPWLALPLASFAALAEGQEPESTGSKARGRGGFGALKEKGRNLSGLLV